MSMRLWKMINFSSIGNLLELLRCYYLLLRCARSLANLFQNYSEIILNLSLNYWMSISFDERHPLLCGTPNFLFQRNINGNKNFFFKLCKNYAGMILNFSFFLI